MYAYCENNPVNTSDPSGAFGIVLAAIVSATVNVASTYIAAKVTGQEYSVVDGLVAAAVGAVNVIPGVGTFIAGAISGSYSAYTSIKNGATVGEAALSFVASGLATTASIANLANLGIKTIEAVAANALSDMVFGTGYNILAAATNKAIAIKAVIRQNNKTSSTNYLTTSYEKPRSISESKALGRRIGATYNVCQVY